MKITNAFAAVMLAVAAVCMVLLLGASLLKIASS